MTQQQPTAVPVLWIDGRATRLLKSLVSTTTGNTYFAPSKQAVRFGVRIDAQALPNGLDTTFSIGTSENAGVALATTTDDDNKAKRRGDMDVELFGRKMTAKVTLHRMDDDFFNLVVKVVNRGEKTILKGDEIYI